LTYLGGTLSEKFGAKWLIGVGTFLAGVLTLFNPLAARSGGIGALISLRVLQGLVQVRCYVTILERGNILYQLLKVCSKSQSMINPIYG